jgi:hypothetical protein
VKSPALQTKSGTLVFVHAFVLHLKKVASRTTTSAKKNARANAPTESAPTSKVSHNTSTIVIAPASASRNNARLAKSGTYQNASAFALQGSARRAITGTTMIVCANANQLRALPTTTGVKNTANANAL